MKPSLAYFTALLLLAVPPAAVAAITATEPPGEFSGEGQVPDAPWCLWYKRPAAVWTEALPVGNGKLGAMVFGGVASEHIQFNESTVWTGVPHSYAHEGAAGFLPEIRKFLCKYSVPPGSGFRGRGWRGSSFGGGKPGRS